MPSWSIHKPGSSVLHRANPMTKLAALLCSAAFAFALPVQMTWLATVALLLTAFPLGIGGVVLRRFAVLALPFLIAVLVFHSLILARPDYTVLIGPLTYSPEGFAYAAMLGGRISLMLAASLLFVATTHPSTLLRSLDSAGLPPGISFLLATPLLLIDEFTARAGAIRDAQQARGMRVDTAADRIRALKQLTVPLITLALADAQERSSVLTSRAFRAYPRRSVLEPPSDSLTQKYLRYGLCALVFLVFGYAFV